MYAFTVLRLCIKKVNVELNQPTAQEYYIGNEIINALPMQVELKQR